MEVKGLMVMSFIGYGNIIYTNNNLAVIAMFHRTDLKNILFLAPTTYCTTLLHVINRLMATSFILIVNLL